MDCSYCTNKEIEGETIIKNDLAFAFPTYIPIVPGHILVCPLRHIQYYEDATKQEREAIEDLRNKLKSALIKSFGAEGFNYAWNEGEIGGQGVMHFHLHIVPRKKGDAGIYQYDPRKFLYRPGPRTVRTPHEELSEVARIIREAL